MSMPARVKVPVPIFVRATVPEPSWIVPENVLVWSSPPKVKVTAPLVPEVTVPPPLRPFKVTPWPPRSNVPSSTTLNLS